MTGWRIPGILLKRFNGHSRASVHALDGDGCAIVVRGQRQLGGVGRSRVRYDGEEQHQQQAEGMAGANGGGHFDRDDASCLGFPPDHNRNVGTGERRRGGGNSGEVDKYSWAPLIADADCPGGRATPSLPRPCTVSQPRERQLTDPWHGMCGSGFSGSCRCRPKLGTHTPCRACTPRGIVTSDFTCLSLPPIWDYHRFLLFMTWLW